MPDQIIDAVMARSIQADVVRTHPLAAWVIARDQVDYPGQLVARLVTDAPTAYVLLSDTLGGLHAQLPPGLVRDRTPASRAARGSGDLATGIGRDLATTTASHIQRQPCEQPGFAIT